MSVKSEKAKEKAECIEYLREAIKPGDTVYTSVPSVSSNGMSRHIIVMIPTRDDKTGKLGIRDITYLVGHALGYKRSDKTGGLVVSGCGMDMGFHVVYTLARVLFTGPMPIPDGVSPSSGDRDRGVMTDTGYALRQSWL